MEEAIQGSSGIPELKSVEAVADPVKVNTCSLYLCTFFMGDIATNDCWVKWV